MLTQYKMQKLHAVLCATALLAVAPAHSAMTAEELAKLAQNPVGNLISVPFQNNTNFNYGPQSDTQNILNIQPVIPISVSPEWNIITRTIIPVISQPALSPAGERKDGVGDTVFTAFLSPANPGKWIWGAGPVLQLPTNSRKKAVRHLVMIVRNGSKNSVVFCSRKIFPPPMGHSSRVSIQEQGRVNQKLDAISAVTGYRV